jgi:hypothetical protein
MTMWTALLIVLAVFAFGDIISQLTKARLSSLFVIMMTFLVLFLFKVIPADIIKQAGLTTLGPISMVMLLFNMGTTIDLALLKHEWRSVAASCLAMAIAIASCLLIIPLIGRANALVAAPVINGGIIATTTMVKAATDQGLPLTAALAAFLYATQKFVGTLPASYFGLKAAGRYVEDFRRMKQEDPSFSLDNNPRPETGKKASFAERNSHRFTIYISLAIAAFAAYLGTLGGKLTHNWVGMFLWCMILGMVARNLGLVPANIIKKNANASGFFIFGALTAIVPSLAKVDFSMLGQLGFLVLCVFAVTVAGIILAFKVLPLWKIVGDKDLCIGIAMCQMIGYPGTQLISEEISKAVGRTPEEIEYLEKRIGTAYVISGFTSVTVLSIVVATIMAKIL